MSQEKKFYVYVHRYSSGHKEGRVFYVGKGSGKRVSDVKFRNQYWNRVVNKYGCQFEILQRFSEEVCAFSFERALIAFYGRDNLCNMTDGGEGCVNLDKSSIVKMSLAKKGKKQPPRSKEHCFAISVSSKIPVVSSLGEIFDSGKDAVSWLRSNGFPTASRGNIASCINGNMSSAYGRTWARLGDTPKEYKSLRSMDKAKSVIRSDGALFDSASSAARCMSNETGNSASQGNISMVCRGERKTAYGYSWKYADD